MKSLNQRLYECFNEAYTPPKGINVTMVGNHLRRYVLFSTDSKKEHLIVYGTSTKSMELVDLGIKYKKGDKIKFNIPTLRSTRTINIEITGENDVDYTAKEV